ncbi:MAG TPA: flagellar filament capping protein FliD [Verrucomicrobiae bacterium]|nr:flagellar filament capping protein FliD [Verrucomicrobiae bacterium]
MASTTGVDLSVSGLASGMDWKTVVSELADAERAPETQWKATQSTINQKNAAFTQIQTFLTSLQTDVQALKVPSLYAGRTATSSDSTVATASAGSGAAMGTFAFHITQFAASSRITGAANIAQSLSPDGNLNNVTIGTASFPTPVTSGTFTVDGAQVTISATDSLQTVFDNIAKATNNKVTASYSPGSDEITLTSSDNSEIILGSAADTSNFLQVAKLYNIDKAGPVSSASSLGSVNVSALMTNSHLTTPLTDGGSGTGQFTINGIPIAYNAAADSIQNVLDRINSSSAGVTASYDTLQDRFVLFNKSGGDTGIVLQDTPGQGNFLAATGLAGGAFTHGQNMTYTINGGAPLVSQSNTIDPSSSGLTGVSVTFLKQADVTVTVASDTGSIKTAIENFINDYNAVQSFIGTQAATSTDATGKVTAGLLTGDMDAANIVSTLRSTSVAQVPGLTSSLDQLADLGIQTNGQDNTITLADSSALDTALQNNLNTVQSLFSDPTNGIATQLDTVITSFIGDSGSLTNHQTTLTNQSTAIDTQIANLEKVVTADSKKWTTEFEAMEQAQAQVNQELSYLTQQVTNWGKA